MGEQTAVRDLGVYIHWPFCEAICPYCDFNVRRARHVDHAVWLAAFRRAILAWRGVLDGRRVESIFFGGGTPSLMPPATVAGILDALADVWVIAADVEITLEANPTSVEAARFRDFAQAGVNRLSVGIQALDDDALDRLGRRHTAREACDALSIAQDVCPRVSFDLIYGRPHQSLTAWKAELDRALRLGGDHCSLYQLTIEDGTPFARQRKRGRLPGLPDDNRSAEFYDLTGTVCDAHGLSRYEVSNYARDGDQSRHNRIYWTAGDWIGIGPGAHGRLTINDRRVGTIEESVPGDWLEQAGSPVLTDDRTEHLTREEAAEEVLFSGLRLKEGLSIAALERWGYEMPADRLAHLLSDGLLRRDGGQIRTTAAGTVLIDAIVADLVPLHSL
ncbi:MAG: radical SAM family heme chaperone HemW [Pseudomonadota bacterium]